MVRIRDLNPRGVTLNKEQRYNLHLLHTTLNEIGAEWGKPLQVNSAFRTMAEHLQIYKEKNAKRIAQGQEPIPVPLRSVHLIAGAADIEDPTNMLFHFILGRMQMWDSLDLDVYLESSNYTHGYVHIQVVPPLSGSRVFVPY